MFKRFQQSYSALGSQVIVTLVCTNELTAETIFARIKVIIATFERRFSRFSPDSELTLLNSRAGRKFSISSPMHELLTTAKKISRSTGELYNPFVLPALQRAGYLGSWPTPSKIGSTPDYTEGQVAHIASLEIGESWVRIPANTALDFGGIGKGFLLDKLQTYIETQPDISGFWCSLGGDIICSGFDLHNQPWGVGVQHAHDAQRVVHTFINASGSPMAVATSGITKRKGVNGQNAWHHIIDPRSGKPAATNILTSTVSAATGTQADVLAKCIVIAGSKFASNKKASGEIIDYIIQEQQ